MRMNTDKPSAEEEMLLKARKEQADALELALEATQTHTPVLNEKGKFTDLIAGIDALNGELAGKRKKDVEEEEDSDDEEEEEEDDLEEDDEEDFEDEDDFEEEFDDDDLDDDDDDIFYDDEDDE